MPETGALPEPWYSTPNIHLCTLRDFVSLCDALELRIDACASLADGKPARPIDPRAPIENWRAETALFLLSRKAEPLPASVPQQNLFGEVELPKAEAPTPRARRRR
jgi:hypothetical protein